MRGCRTRVAGFVLPLGTSINHAGSALYECAAALFIAQAYGLHLSLATQFTVVLLALVTSMGIAGIPAASLVGITVILTAVGLPAEGDRRAAGAGSAARHGAHRGQRAGRLRPAR